MHPSPKEEEQEKVCSGIHTNYHVELSVAGLLMKNVVVKGGLSVSVPTLITSAFNIVSINI